jgi:LacI family transcriptional regulator
MQKKKPTLQNVADKAGVSTATVSRCLNQPEKVRAAVQVKINEAIQELAYVPDGAARALASRRTHTIGAIVPTIDNAIFPKAIQYLQTGLTKANFTLLLANSGYSLDEELREVQSFISRGIDGIVLIGEQHHPEVYASIKRHQIPLVNLWTYNPNSAHSCIGYDHIKAGEHVAQHLLDLGHTEIGVISGHLENNDRAIIRLKGIKETILKVGCGLADNKIIECNYSVEQGCEKLHQLLDRHPRTTAIICGNDLLAIGALAGARDRGLNVPKDLSITGFDNLEILPFLTPSLTTVNSPSRRMGEKAAEYLIKQIQNGTSSIEHIELQADLIVRETTGPAPKSNK